MIHQGYRFGDRHVLVEMQRSGDGRFSARVDGEAREVEARLVDPSTLQLTVDGRSSAVRVARVGEVVHVAVAGRVYVLAPAAAGTESGGHATLASPRIVAPMPGKILELLVAEGQEVKAGDGLLILEAMKMENRMTAEAAGTVTRVHVEAGQMVDGGALLLELEYVESGSES